MPQSKSRNKGKPTRRKQRQPKEDMPSKGGPATGPRFGNARYQGPPRTPEKKFWRS